MPRPPLTPDWPSGPAEARSKKKRCPSAAAAGLSAYRFVVSAGIGGSGENDLSCCTWVAVKPLKGSFPQAHSMHVTAAKFLNGLVISSSVGFPWRRALRGPLHRLKDRGGAAKCKLKLNAVEPATASSRSAAADGAGAKELAGKAAQNTRQLKRNARYRRSGGARLERCSKQFELLDSSGPPHPGGPANPAVVWSGWVI